MGAFVYFHHHTLKIAISETVGFVSFTFIEHELSVSLVERRKHDHFAFLGFKFQHLLDLCDQVRPKKLRFAQRMKLLELEH